MLEKQIKNTWKKLAKKYSYLFFGKNIKWKKVQIKGNLKILLKIKIKTNFLFAPCYTKSLDFEPFWFQNFALLIFLI